MTPSQKPTSAQLRAAIKSGRCCVCLQAEPEKDRLCCRPCINGMSQREIQSLGGRIGHVLGRSHRFDSKEARRAGRKGGAATSQDREHMSRIGRVGGKARHGLFATPAAVQP